MLGAALLGLSALVVTGTSYFCLLAVAAWVTGGILALNHELLSAALLGTALALNLLALTPKIGLRQMAFLGFLLSTPGLVLAFPWRVARTGMENAVIPMWLPLGLSVLLLGFWHWRGRRLRPEERALFFPELLFSLVLPLLLCCDLWQAGLRNLETWCWFGGALSLALCALAWRLRVYALVFSAQFAQLAALTAAVAVFVKYAWTPGWPTNWFLLCPLLTLFAHVFTLQTFRRGSVAKPEAAPAGLAGLGTNIRVLFTVGMVYFLLCSFRIAPAYAEQILAVGGLALLLLGQRLRQKEIVFVSGIFLILTALTFLFGMANQPQEQWPWGWVVPLAFFTVERLFRSLDWTFIPWELNHELPATLSIALFWGWLGLCVFPEADWQTPSVGGAGPVRAGRRPVAQIAPLPALRPGDSWLCIGAYPCPRCLAA